MKLQAAPLTTDITANNRLTPFWITWFRNLGKNLEDSCKIQVKDNVKYVINNANLQIITSGSGIQTINLPYKAAIDQIIPYFYKNDDIWISSFIEISANEASINIPVLNEWKINATIAILQLK